VREFGIEYTRGFVRTQEFGEAAIVTLIKAPCGSETSVEDINDAGMIAVTCLDPLTNAAVTSYAYGGRTDVDGLTSNEVNSYKGVPHKRQRLTLTRVNPGDSACSLA
jgi:hypothetical protein